MTYKPTGNKPGRPKKPYAGGRPTKMTPETVNKLQEAFAIGCTDTEACLFADITRQTLTTYQNANPKFLDRKNILKDTPILTARTRVVSELKSDTGTAKWYLERKAKDEFGTKQEIDLTGKVIINTPGLNKPKDAGK